MSVKVNPLVVHTAWIKELGKLDLKGIDYPNDIPACPNAKKGFYDHNDCEVYLGTFMNRWRDGGNVRLDGDLVWVDFKNHVFTIRYAEFAKNSEGSWKRTYYYDEFEFDIKQDHEKSNEYITVYGLYAKK